MGLRPRPVLLMAPRASRKAAFASGTLAWFSGGLNCWSYYWTLRIPLPVVLLALTIPAVAFGLATLLCRNFIERNRPTLAVLSQPCAWVFYEFINNLSNGT